MLLDRDGNSLDRALLLDRLLVLAGHETRLARGRLGEADALALAKGARATPPFLPYETAPPPQFAAVVERAYDRIEQQVSDLLERLATLRLPAEATVARELNAAADSLGDHWWVQVRREGAWIDLDPSLDQPGRARAIPTETYAAQALPPDLFHQVTFRLVLEHWRGDTRVETRLLELARPAHELPGKTVHVGHVPLGVKQEEIPPGRDASATLQRLTLAPAWLPLIAFGANYLRGNLITAAGDVLEASDQNIARFQPSASGPVGGLGAAVGRLLDGLESLPAGIEGAPAETPDDASAYQGVTAEWLEIEIALPGKEPQLARRELFDLIGAGREQTPRAPPESNPDQHRHRVAAWLGSIQIAVETAKLPVPLVPERLLTKLEPFEPLVGELARSPSVPPDRLMPFLPALAALQVDLDFFAALRWLWNWGSAGVYVDRPNVTALQLALRQQPSGELAAATMIDIVSNRVGIRRIPGLDPFEARLFQGVVDTVTEAALLADSAPLNTAMVHDAALAAGGSLVTLAPTSAIALERLHIPDAARARLVQELASGHVVVLPELPSPNQPSGLAWWRIDPATGQTLGVLPDGTGGALDMLVLVSMALEMASTIVSLGLWIHCVAGGADDVFFVVSLKGASSGERAALCTAEAVTAAVLGIAVAKALKGVPLLRPLLKDQRGTFGFPRIPPVKPSAPAGWNKGLNAFGKEIGWPAAGKVKIPAGEVDLAKLRNAGVTEQWAVEQAQIYREVARYNKANPTAALRAEWLEEIAALLRGAP